MTPRQMLLAVAAGGAILLGSSGVVLAQGATCKEPETGTKAVPALSPPLAHVVTGTGRLQFHSSPNARCRIEGVFVVPNDELIAYAQTNDGWSSVTYTNPRTGKNVSGWVRSARLKETGTVGPKR